MSNVPAAEPPVQEMPHTCAYASMNGMCGKPAEFRMSNRNIWLCQYHYAVMLDVLRMKTLRHWFEEKD
jgi:hypothetical protein